MLAQIANLSLWIAIFEWAVDTLGMSDRKHALND